MSLQSNEFTVPLESDHLFDPRTLTQKDIIDELQNQLQLSQRGLDLLLALYKKPFDSNVHVSEPSAPSHNETLHVFASF